MIPGGGPDPACMRLHRLKDARAAAERWAQDLRDVRPPDGEQARLRGQSIMEPLLAEHCACRPGCPPAPLLRELTALRRALRNGMALADTGERWARHAAECSGTGEATPSLDGQPPDYHWKG